ncbi:TR10B factor, partial [Herpetotheres cachinnans]|nr:TR10B factor [Herpetotheres cachinnans]
AALGAAAAAPDRREMLEPLDPSRGGGELYQVQDSHFYCKKCPAGTYVAQHCKEQNGSSTCLRCKEGEYVEYPNDFLSCLGCQRCREDQVELSPCQAVRNTQCVCKNGTFCSPYHPCELCQKCRRRCPKDEVEQAPCTPHSDRRCGPPTSTFSGSPNYLIITCVVVAVVLFALFCLYKCCCRRPPGEHWRRGTPGALTLAGGSAWGYLMRQLTRHQSRGPGTQDNIHNEQVSRDQLLSTVSGSATPSALGPEVHERDPLLHHAWPRSDAFLCL